jgi:hypothetical protein
MKWLKRDRTEQGRSTSAVVVEYTRGRTSGETPPEGFKTTYRVEALVRVVGDDRVQTASSRVSGLVLWMLAEGDEVPVKVDDDGRVMGWDREAIEALYKGQKAELKESLKPHSVLNDLRRELGVDAEQLADIGPALRDLAAVPKQWFDAATAPAEAPSAVPDPAPPIDGVTFSTFVAVQAALVRERVAPARYDEVAQRHGVPAGGWAAAQAAWMARVKSDPAIGQAFGTAYAAAVQGP